MIGIFEQKRALVNQFNLMDDTFCSLVLKDKEACEYLLTALLGKSIDEKNHERRLRYYRTAIDWSYLKKGKSYLKLPELYMIFISNFDPFELNKNHYEIKQYVDESIEKALKYANIDLQTYEKYSENMR